MPDSSSFIPLFVTPVDSGRAAEGGACSGDGCRVPAGDTVEVDTARRFGGLDRLYGDGAHDALSQLHVVVAGIGGVGTWCVEALARSGAGALTLVDLDHIAESNVNRQVHALTSTLGQSKVLAMAARVRDINPLCRVRCVDDFVEAGNLSGILVPPGAWSASALPGSAQAEDVGTGAAPGGTGASTQSLAGSRTSVSWRSVLVDCTDQVAAKVAMILRARELGWPALACGGAGGKTDPMALRAGDLSAAANDALLARVRQDLRKRHGYPKGGAAGGKPRRRPPRMGVPCLWFDQPVVLPAAWARAATPSQPSTPSQSASSSQASPAVAPALQPIPSSGPQGLSCAGYGSAVTVTATMGMAAADWAIRQGLSASA